MKAFLLYCCCCCFWFGSLLVGCLLPKATHGWETFARNPMTTIRRGPTRPTMEHFASSRRDMLETMASVTACTLSGNPSPLSEDYQSYTLRFPTLFAPLYGDASRKTIKRSLGANNSSSSTIWALEQNLELGPLQTPLRCTVVRLKDGSLWVHAPLAPTKEFFDLVESCGSHVSHVVVPTYALEHKVFVKDCLSKWPDAQLWTSPEQFSFPIQSVSEEFVFGKSVTSVLKDSKTDDRLPPWADEIEYKTLQGGTFSIGGKPTTLSETVFFHKASKSLIVTDCLAKISERVPPLNDPQNLLLISKRSTADPMPADSPKARLDGWKKTVLLVSYFFPEHEELDKGLSVVWTDGWEENFRFLQEPKILVPPVVRTLLYAQNPGRVQDWVDSIQEWDFDQIVPAHWEAPIEAKASDVARAFLFLKDPRVDAFPKADLERGLQPIANFVRKQL